MNLSIKSSKINVKEGQHLLDIIPSEQDLFASIQIPVNFANKVSNQMEVNIIFPTSISSSPMIATNFTPRSLAYFNCFCIFEGDG